MLCILLRRLDILVLVIFLLPIKISAQKNPSEGGSGKYTKLVWQEEFNNEGLPDSTKWKYDTGYLRNHEKQYYTYRRIENAEIKNGLLDITARNDSFRTDGVIHP